MAKLEKALGNKWAMENMGKRGQFQCNDGGAGRSRTGDLRFRKPPLYPSELQPHMPQSYNKRPVP